MARKFAVHWVDAFTATPLQGNACAVVLDARGLDDAQMQAIARETNLSETSFVFPGDGDADVRVRYWTPIGEIPMAGHPTVATAHALCETGALAAAQTVRFGMPAGIVPVTIRPQDARPYAMSQPPPVFGAPLARAEAARALGLTEDDLFAGVVPCVVSTGTPQLMIALASRAALERCRPDRAALFSRPGRSWFSVHVFAPGGDGAALCARHFADFGDVAEDPFTGSATGGMAAYCARYAIVRERRYLVHQGAHVHRPGSAEVSFDDPPSETIGRITVAGAAITVLRGVLTL